MNTECAEVSTTLISVYMKGEIMMVCDRLHARYILECTSGLGVQLAKVCIPNGDV